MSRRRAQSVAVACCLAGAVVAAEPAALEFHRVRVPAGRLGDVPLGDDRYVPMPLTEFDAAVARARAAADAVAAEPTPPASMARWRASIDSAGRLVGTITCEVGEATAGRGRVLSLGPLRVLRGVRTGEPPAEATICGLGSGLAISIPEPGIYELEFVVAPVARAAAEFRVPLVPALTTVLDIELPPGMRPRPSGAAARRAVVTAPVVGTGDPWRIEVGPATEIVLSIEPVERPSPPVAVWSEIVLAGPRAEFAAAVIPATAWREGPMVLEQDPAARVTEIRARGDDDPLDHQTAADGRSITVFVPRWVDGERTPLEIRGLAPATGPVWRLPLMKAAGNAWAGGGTVVRVDPASAVRDLVLEECRVVSPEMAAAWPVPTIVPPAAAARPGAIYHVEQQGPDASLDVVLGQRTATFDVARVTTVDITPGAVLGRAACDVRVTGGDAYEITARVAPGWIIDAVDAFVPDGDETAGPGGAVAAAARSLDWRVVPSPVGDALRIGLPFGTFGPGGLGLRIVGHRGGLVPGVGFTTADIDMVRFEGETADAAVIDLRTDAEAFVEVAGRPAGWFEVDGRLAPLVEEGKARGRIHGGDRAGDVEARIVQRRPPLDVRVDVRLEPREEVLVQTFTFDCRAEAGLESLIIDFAEPVGDEMTWRVESPAGVTATARPLDASEGGLASRGEGIASSLLVELSPVVSEPVRIRGVRSIPFVDAVPVPLAWVEGAVAPGGTVVIAAPAGRRPRLANRGLRELPTAAEAGAPPAEFAYGPPTPGVGADLAPVPADADARAWAWRETVACWCDESGATEIESRFDIENEGRGVLSLALARGRRLEAVFVDGVSVPDLDFGSAGGTWSIPLPPGERRVEVVVRTLTSGRSSGGAWRVDPIGCSVDVPVLDRDVRLLLPPNLVSATPATDARVSWAARLLGIGGGEEGEERSTRYGYRSEPITVTPGRSGIVFICSRTLLRGAALLAAAGVGIASYYRGRRRSPLAWLPTVAAAVAALWLSPAFVPVARAASWGGLVGLLWTQRRGLRDALARAVGPTRRGAAAALIVAAFGADLSADEYRVFITPGAGGDTALVPEPLFRSLAAFAARDSAAIRVLACRIDAGAAASEPVWRLVIDVDADAGGVATLDAGPAARWLPGSAGGRGMSVRIAERETRLTADEPGRHSVELLLAPAVERRGPVEVTSARIPVAPTATLRLADGDITAGGLDCERALGGDAFGQAPPAPGGVDGAVFDVSVADRVRLVRPVDPRDRLLAAVRTAATANDLSWDAGGCRVEATFDVDAESDLLRSFVVRADPRLTDLAVTDDGATTARVEPLGGGRLRVELPEAVRGRVRVRLTGRLPLADPVGVFDAPGVWLENVPTEKRTLRLVAAADLDATFDPAPPDGATAADVAGRPTPRVIVRRQRPQVRGTQAVAVSLAATGFGLAFTAQLDATTLALTRIPLEVPVGSAVDRLVLLRDDPADPGSREPVDIEWTRPAADRVLVIVQRPRPGRFRLEVDARLAQPPVPQGRLPVVRARLGQGVPLTITWTAAPPLEVVVDAAAASARFNSIEVPDDVVEPDYALVADEPAAESHEPATASAPEGDGSRVEQTEVRVAFDGRGRVHGFARFDVATPAATVRLRLPPGMRLFDVLVDGRPVAAEPRSIDAWDVPLGIAPWPRTILAVFAGETGSALVEDRPLSLPAPILEGFAAGEVLWWLRPPQGFMLLVAPPGRRLDAAEFAAARAAADERIADACVRTAATVAEPERGRLEALAALRREGRGSVAEETWRRSAGWAGLAAGGTPLVSSEALVIRAERMADPTRPARAAATVALIVGAGVAWSLVGRRGPAGGG